MWIRLTILATIVLLARCTLLPAFAQVPSTEDPAADQVEAVLQADILPLFEESPGLVYGVETILTFEDRDYPAIRYVVVTLVRAIAAPDGRGRLIVEEVRTFRAMPGLAPRLLAVSDRRPWPY
jgi:hypothetical protein